jgi:predicted restriction endonuclease
MDSATILQRFDDLGIWKQGDQRAPHKPLLVLYALGRWQRGQTDVTFRQAEPELTALLREFGPSRRSDHPEQPNRTTRTMHSRRSECRLKRAIVRSFDRSSADNLGELHLLLRFRVLQ